MALNEATCEDWFVHIGNARNKTPDSRNTMVNIGGALRKIERSLQPDETLVGHIRQLGNINVPAGVDTGKVHEHLNALGPAAAFVLNHPNMPDDVLPSRFSPGFWDRVAARL